jgi:hypothetical protein
MEAESSLSCSQKPPPPPTGPYPEPDESNSRPHIIFLQDLLLCFPPLYDWILQVVSPIQVHWVGLGPYINVSEEHTAFIFRFGVELGS